MIARLSNSVLIAILFLVAVLVGCATALSATGNAVPDWFQTLAVAGFGGVLGAYQPANPVVSAPSATTASGVRPAGAPPAPPVGSAPAP